MKESTIITTDERKHYHNDGPKKALP